jgi:hypothetical protein
MNPSFDPSTLPPPAQRILDPNGPAPLRQMAAKGIAPGLKPGDSLTVVWLLASAEDAQVSATAAATLDKLPAPLLNGALSGRLPAGVLDRIAPIYAKDAALMEKVLAHQDITPETVATVAAIASEPVCELIATNEQRLLAHPVIIERLYLNKATRMSTADRILELAVRNNVELNLPAFEEAAQAIQGELVVEASPEPTPDDLAFQESARLAEGVELSEGEDTHVVDETTGEEKPSEKVLPLHAQLASMTISQKIRKAILGSAAERMILVRDPNRMVAMAAVKSPMIQENEIMRISQSRTVSDAVLGAIARSKQWMSSHEIKVNLVANPRTPMVYTMKYIGHLRDDELKALAKSKNVPGSIVQLAKQTLNRRNPEKKK